jgi:hypothetical protein
LLQFPMSLPYKGSQHSTCQISYPFSDVSVVPENPSISEAIVHTSQQIFLWSEGHPLPSVHNCLFNIFAATIRIWRQSPLSATWGCAVPCHCDKGPT